MKEIEIHEFDAGRLERFPVRGNDFVNWADTVINEESCVAAFQEFRPEEPMGYWVMFYDEIHYGLSGEADLIYKLPPNYDEEKTVRVKAGSLYLLPIGADTNWRVVGDEPYRSLFDIMPRPKGGLFD